VDADTVFGQPGSELFQILIQVRDDLRPDGVRPLASFLPIGQGGKGVNAALYTARSIGV
jgi:hypothetical protein